MLKPLPPICPNASGSIVLMGLSDNILKNKGRKRKEEEEFVCSK